MTGMTRMVKEVYDYRELLLALTYRDIRVKYKQAVMGILWAFVLPVLSIGAGIMVQIGIGYVSNPETFQVSRIMENIISVMVRTSPWALFTGVLSGTANGLLGGMGLASRIYFPRQIIPLSNTLSVLFDFLIGLCVVILLVAIVGAGVIHVTPMLLVIPLLMVVLVSMALGLGLMFGSANLFFRDVKYILGVLLQFGVFFTPVYLFVDQLGAFGQYMLFNPVAPLLEAISSIVIRGHIGDGMMPYLIYSIGFAAFTLITGVTVFRRTEHLFAEVL